MALVSASTLIRRMFGKLEVFSPGESIPPADSADAFDDLNMMIGAWALQPLTMPVVARETFALTSDVGTYTIGPGGDFDTVRPNQNDLTGAALLLNNDTTPVSVVSLSRVGALVTATVTSHGAATGQNVTINGALPAAFNGTFPITVTGVNTFTYLFGGSVTSPATGTITALFESTSSDVVEQPCPVITDDARQWIQIKSLTSPLFTSVYYTPTFYGGLGTIELWPIPTVSTHALVIYRRMALAKFPNLTTQFQLPDGLDEAIVYNLAMRRASDYGKGVLVQANGVKEMAGTSLGNFKRGNTKMSDLVIDPAFTQNNRGTYNIITDVG